MSGTMGVIKYHWRRRWFVSTVYVVLMIAIVLVSAAALMTSARETSIIVDSSGRIVTRDTYNSVAFLDDPSRLINPSAFGMLVFLCSFAILKRDRMFLVSLSMPRYQVLTGSFAFLVSLSAALALVGGVIAPFICRAILLIVGFPLKGGWSAATLFTGGDPDLPMNMLASMLEMIGSAGICTLVGYVFLRWWKPLLILFGAGIAAILLMVTMIQWETFLAGILVDFAKWVNWAAEQLIPLIQRFFEEDNRMVWALREFGAGLACIVLSYPVMRGMKVV